MIEALIARIEALAILCADRAKQIELYEADAQSFEESCSGIWAQYDELYKKVARLESDKSEDLSLSTAHQEKEIKELKQQLYDASERESALIIKVRKLAAARYETYDEHLLDIFKRNDGFIARIKAIRNELPSERPTGLGLKHAKQIGELFAADNGFNLHETGTWIAKLRADRPVRYWLNEEEIATEMEQRAIENESDRKP